MISSATRSSAAVVAPGSTRRATSASTSPTSPAARRSPCTSCSLLRWMAMGVLAASAADAARLHEPVVVPHEEVALHLLQRVQRHADEDEQAGAAEELREAGEDAELHDDGRQDGDEPDEERARQRDPREDVVDELAGLAARPDA